MDLIKELQKCKVKWLPFYSRKKVNTLMEIFKRDQEELYDKLWGIVEKRNYPEVQKHELRKLFPVEVEKRFITIHVENGNTGEWEEVEGNIQRRKKICVVWDKQNKNEFFRGVEEDCEKMCEKMNNLLPWD